MLSAIVEKDKFFLLKKTIYGYFRLRITMRKCKTKTIEVYLGIFTHFPTYSDIFTPTQAQCDIFRNYASISRHIQNCV